MIEKNDTFEFTKDKPIMYVFDNELLTSDEGKILLNDITIPQLFDYHWKIAQFMWGPSGSGAPLHFHQDAWNAVLFGKKSWSLYPTHNSSYSKKIYPDWNAPYYCDQYPGDIVYVPDAWSHAVYNHGLTCAIAMEFNYP